MSVVGIDIGTTYAYLAISKNREINVVESIEGRRIVCCVGFNEHERLIGESAVYRMTKNPGSTITGVKQLLGRNLTARPGFCFFEMEFGKNSPNIVVNYRGMTRIFRPEQIFAMILWKLKTVAENATGETIFAAVITVPPHFNTAQRVAIKDAANIAGIHVLGLLSETLAAAIDYVGTRELHPMIENVMIVHVGGGGFDISILSVGRGFIHVLSNEGIVGNGGVHLTYLLWEKMKGMFKQRSHINIDDDPRAKSKLWLACEKAKLDLTLGTSTRIRIDALANGREFDCELTRASFNEVIKENVSLIVMSAIKALGQAKMTEDQIHTLFFVGGGTRVPLITEKLFKQFTKLRAVWRKTISVDEAPVRGAAVWAEQLTRPVGRPNELHPRLQISDVLPCDLVAAVQLVGDIPIAMKGSAIPLTSWITGIGVSRSPSNLQLWDVGDSPDINTPSGNCTITGDGSLIKCNIGIDGIPDFSAHFYGAKDPFLHIGMSVQEKTALTKELTEINNEEIKHEKRRYEMHQLERIAYSLVQNYSGKHSQCEAILNWIQTHPDARLEDIELQKNALKKLANKMKEDYLSTLKDNQTTTMATSRHSHQMPAAHSSNSHPDASMATQSDIWTQPQSYPGNEKRGTNFGCDQQAFPAVGQTSNPIQLSNYRNGDTAPRQSEMSEMPCNGEPVSYRDQQVPSGATGNFDAEGAAVYRNDKMMSNNNQPSRKSVKKTLHESKNKQGPTSKSQSVRRK